MTANHREELRPVAGPRRAYGWWAVFLTLTVGCGSDPQTMTPPTDAPTNDAEPTHDASADGPLDERGTTTDVPTDEATPLVDAGPIEDAPSADRGTTAMDVSNDRGTPGVDATPDRGNPAADVPAVDVPRDQGTPAMDVPRDQGTPATDVPRDQGTPAMDVPRDQGTPTTDVPRDQGTPTVDVPRPDVQPTDTGVGPCSGPGPVVTIGTPTADEEIETCSASGMQVFYNFTASVTGSAAIRSVTGQWRSPPGTLAPPAYPPLAAPPYVWRRQVGGPMGEAPALSVFPDALRGTWRFEVTAMDACGRTVTATRNFTLTFTMRRCPNP